MCLLSAPVLCHCASFTWLLLLWYAWKCGGWIWIQLIEFRHQAPVYNWTVLLASKFEHQPQHSWFQPKIDPTVFEAWSGHKLRHHIGAGGSWCTIATSECQPRSVPPTNVRSRPWRQKSQRFQKMMVYSMPCLPIETMRSKDWCIFGAADCWENHFQRWHWMIIDSNSTSIRAIWDLHGSALIILRRQRSLCQMWTFTLQFVCQWGSGHVPMSNECKKSCKDVCCSCIGHWRTVLCQ